MTTSRSVRTERRADERRMAKLVLDDQRLTLLLASVDGIVDADEIYKWLCSWLSAGPDRRQYMTEQLAFRRNG